MLKAKVLEIFRSIQGEAKYLGAAQVFVRFFECNMHCVWCDTPGSIGDTTREYKEYSSEQLLDIIRPMYEGCHSVSITGGEPLVQTEFLKEFLPKLRHEGMKIFLETNGVMPIELREIIDLVDIVSMDLKLPSSTKERAYWKEHEEFLRIARVKETFTKTVISMDTNDDEVYQAVSLVAKIDPSILFILQPNFLDMKSGVIPKCQEYHSYAKKFLDDVRIIPQTHKYMKLR